MLLNVSLESIDFSGHKCPYVSQDLEKNSTIILLNMFYINLLSHIIMGNHNVKILLLNNISLVL